MSTAPDFTLGEEQVRGILVLRPSGELDVSAAPAIRARLVDAALGEPPLLVVDCSGLNFIDSSGISVLIHIHVRLEEQGGELRLAAVPLRISRVLELAGVLGLLHTCERVEDALTPVRHKAS